MIIDGSKSMPGYPGHLPWSSERGVLWCIEGITSFKEGN